MPDTPAVPGASPQLPAARAEVLVAVEPVPPPPSPPKKKDQEDANIEVYERVFKKCMGAASRVLNRDSEDMSDETKARQVEIAAAIFDRFYSDQSSMKAGAVQAKAMIDGMTQVLEGRR